MPKAAPAPHLVENDGVAPPEETNRQRFERLATSRTHAVVEALRRLEAIGYSNVVEYETADVEKILGLLATKFNSLKTALVTRKKAASHISLF